MLCDYNSRVLLEIVPKFTYSFNSDINYERECQLTSSYLIFKGLSSKFINSRSQ